MLATTPKHLNLGPVMAGNTKHPLFIFQGGGPTAVINATLSGILEKAGDHYSAVYGLKHSLESPLADSLMNLTPISYPEAARPRALLANTPGAILGSSRKKVEEAQLQQLLDLMGEMGASDIIGIGGNGTMSVLSRLTELAQSKGNPLRVVGAPKTVDNDLQGVFFAPGFGSAARFVALAVRDCDCDFRAMQTFDDVTILETMGRSSGWIAASSVLLKQNTRAAPHMVLLPERLVDMGHFLNEVARIHKEIGRVFIVTNEMLKDIEGNVLGAEFQDGPKDSLGRPMYSLSTGTGNYLARQINQQLGLQARCLRPGSLGRAFSSCVSEVDFDLAVRIGHKAIELIRQGETKPIMISVDADLSLGSLIINEGCLKKPMPESFLSQTSRFFVSDKFSDAMRKIIGKVEPIWSSPDRR